MARKLFGEIPSCCSLTLLLRLAWVLLKYACKPFFGPCSLASYPNNILAREEDTLRPMCKQRVRPEAAKTKI